MSIIQLTSASGAPGVTTTTLGLACTWPRPAIAVEADAGGGSAFLAGYFRGFTAPIQSVVDLLLAHRADRLSEQFPQCLIPIDGTPASVLPGPRSHAQAFSALELWEPLSMTWKALHGESDVLIDAGRLGSQWYPESLLSLSDLVLLVTRSDLPSLAAAKQWANQALETRDLHPEYPPWAVLLIGEGKPYSSREVSSVLGLPVVCQISLDSRGAEVYSHGVTRMKRNRLDPQFVHCGESIRTLIRTTQGLLSPKGGS